MEALQRLPECPSDVIILDLIMPQMDGFGVLEQVQRIPPEQRPPGDRPDRPGPRGFHRPRSCGWA